MLKLLGALAAPLANNTALRQFIDHAANPLSTLFGYFVAIDEREARLPFGRRDPTPVFAAIEPNRRPGWAVTTAGRRSG